MKWKQLTKPSGDKGNSHFGMKGGRLSKGHRIFEILGEIDMLNAYLGMCYFPSPLDTLEKIHKYLGEDLDPTSAVKLQSFNRKYMGYLHTGAKKSGTLLDQELEDLNAALDILTTDLDALDPNGPQGWHDYDSAWFLACCQCRKVERLLVLSWEEKTGNTPSDYGKIIFPNMEDGEKILAIYNRMSKVLYCLGILYSKTEKYE